MMIKSCDFVKGNRLRQISLFVRVATCLARPRFFRSSIRLASFRGIHKRSVFNSLIGTSSSLNFYVYLPNVLQNISFSK